MRKASHESLVLQKYCARITLSLYDIQRQSINEYRFITIHILWHLQGLQIPCEYIGKLILVQWYYKYFGCTLF